MNIQDPWHNIREACKQALLLEDHLFHKAKNCPDCISKHLLMMEALLEEAITLDETGQLRKLLENLLARVWTYQTFWVSKRVTNQQLAQALRKWRKGILVTSFLSQASKSCKSQETDWKGSRLPSASTARKEARSRLGKGSW
jgi:hypothetical protein